MQSSIVNITEVRYDRIPSWNIDNLMAPFWRLYWNKAEGAYLVQGTTETPLLPNNYCLVPAHTKYLGRADQPVDHLYVHFYLGWSYPHREPITYPMTRGIKSHLKRVAALCRSEQTEEVKAEKHLIANTMVFSALSRIDFGDFETDSKDVRMEEAIEYMLEHLNRGVSNERLAKKAGMSLSTFLREFRKRYNITPAKYLNLLRVDVAASLLHHGDDSIEEIAEETGFYDRYHLTKVFKRHRSVSPAAFRKLMQKK